MRHLESPISSVARENTLGVGSSEYPCLGKENTFVNILALEAVHSQASEGDQEDILRVAERVAEAINASKNILSNVPSNVPSHVPLRSREIERLLYAIQCNAHRVLDRGRPLSLGIFPLTSMMNHSCLPNCAHYFVVKKGQPPKIVMRCIKAVRRGEELTYTYVGLYEATVERQAKLRAAYGFLCDCERCKGDEGDDDCVLGIPLEPSSQAAVYKLYNEISVCEKLLDQVAARDFVTPSAASSKLSSSRSPALSVYRKLVSNLTSHAKVNEIHPCHKVRNALVV